MRIFKVINNNMVSVKDDDGKETMLKGLSIGYKKKPGDRVDEDRIEKRFVLEDKMIIRRFNEILIDIDKDIVDVCIDAIDVIKKKSKVKLSDAIYVTIIDHVNGLIERIKCNMTFDNTILWDLKRLYTNEYELAREMVTTLNEVLPYSIDEDEANFITLHIVNAERFNNMNATYHITNVINDICDIVLSDLDAEFDSDDYYYNRFIMHVRFLLENIEERSNININTDNVALETLIISYPEAFDTVEKISAYIENCLGYKLGRDEKLYLMIHLVQIIRSCV